MELIYTLLIAFCAGWGFMDILERIKIIPRVGRLALLLVFSVVLGKVL